MMEQDKGRLPTRKSTIRQSTIDSSHLMEISLLQSNAGSSRNTLQSDRDRSVTSIMKSINEMPSVERDIRNTKLYLQKQGFQNVSLWSHLTNVLQKIISEQPDNVIDYFEEYSRKVKQEQLVEEDTLKDIYVPLPHLESAKNQLSLLNSYGIKEDTEEPAGGEEEEEKEPSSQMDLEEAAFYFREAGVAMPEVQVFTINLVMKKMAEEKSLVKPRFWGKILGTKQDYFVLECELPDEEYEKRVEMEEMEEAAEAERLAAEAADAEAAAAEAAEAAAAAEGLEEEEKLSSAMEEDGEPKKSIIPEEEESIRDEEKDENIPPMEEEEEVNEAHEVKFDLSQEGEEEIGEGEEEGEGKSVVEGEEEEEDPLLPPLPPPNKLLKYKVPPILKPVPKEILMIPAEKIGEGLNRKIYYVSTTPELDWTELPKVTPEQISTAQQIKVYFTGDLDSKIVTYPAFPGSEKNYLRAQIARITAATQVSPIGYYKLPGGGGEEEEEEEVAEEEEGGADQTKCVENPKFQPIPVKDLIDPSFSSWVHHSRYILKQGRADWWNPKKAGAGDEEAEEEQEEEEEDEEKEGGEEKEKGPPLLNPLSEDALVDGSPAWVVRKTRNYNAERAGAVIKSNLWPGAIAVAVGKKCENVYYGWGHKHYPQGFSPAPLPHPEYEYDLGPEVLEIQDPTVEVEQAWRIAHKKKPPPVEGEGEGEEGEEEEEEEEEDD